MKRLFITLFIGILFLSTASIQAQGPFPAKVVGDVVVGKTGILYSQGSLCSGVVRGVAPAPNKNGRIDVKGEMDLPKGIIFESDEVAELDGMLINKPENSANGVRLYVSDQAMASPLDVKVVKKFEKEKYYPIAFPFNVLLSDVTDSSGGSVALHNDFFVLRYDSQNRADHGKLEERNDGEDDSWVWVESETEVLNAGEGYLIYVGEDNAKELIFPAYEGTGDNKAKIEAVRLKMYGGTDGDQVVSLKKYGGVWTESQTTNVSWGWNYVGTKQTCLFKPDGSGLTLESGGTFAGGGNKLYHYDYNVNKLIWQA
ncbi:MAG: hypothetical protein LBH12_03220, partial [Dysgonamonadaceae bacterium]|nr:hypothetical protein [Dysgonamonadaceae bacterium]